MLDSAGDAIAAAAAAIAAAAAAAAAAAVPAIGQHPTQHYHLAAAQSCS